MEVLAAIIGGVVGCVSTGITSYIVHKRKIKKEIRDKEIRDKEIRKEQHKKSIKLKHSKLLDDFIDYLQSPLEKYYRFLGYLGCRLILSGRTEQTIKLNEFVSNFGADISVSNKILEHMSNIKQILMKYIDSNNMNTYGEFMIKRNTNESRDYIALYNSKEVLARSMDEEGVLKQTYNNGEDAFNKLISDINENDKNELEKNFEELYQILTSKLRDENLHSEGEIEKKYITLLRQI